MEWDPDGDAERRKENRSRMIVTVLIVVAILGYIGRWLYLEHERAEQERVLRGLQELQMHPGIGRTASTHGDELRAHSLRRNLFGGLDVEAEHVAIEGQRGREVAHSDADVVKNGFHDG